VVDALGEPVEVFVTEAVGHAREIAGAASAAARGW
jgi:hypothetical protein